MNSQWAAFALTPADSTIDKEGCVPSLHANSTTRDPCSLIPFLFGVQLPEMNDQSAI